MLANGLFPYVVLIFPFFLIAEAPEQPVNLRLMEQQSRSVQISWLESFNGNSPLINYMIQYKLPSGLSSFQLN